VFEPDWDTSLGLLARRSHVPAAAATAALLARARSKWEGRVVPRTSMDDLLFTLPGDEYPFEESVRVSWQDGIYEFWLHVEKVQLLTADRCRENHSSAVLDSFLVQIVPGE
jgi:hypothetical protein